MFRKTVCLAWAVVLSAVLLAGLPAAAAEQVALRVPGGRLLHPAAGGTLQAEAFIPAARETFELVLPGVAAGDGPNSRPTKMGLSPSAEPAKRLCAVRAPDGRWLASDGRTPRLAAAAAEPGPRETFELVPVGHGPLGTPRPQLRPTAGLRSGGRFPQG